MTMPINQSSQNHSALDEIFMRPSQQTINDRFISEEYYDAQKAAVCKGGCSGRCGASF